MSHLSCRVGMGGIRELLDGKIWEWDLSFRREWEWNGNGNGGNWYEKSVPAHLYPESTRGTVDSISLRLDDCFANFPDHAYITQFNIVYGIQRLRFISCLINQ